MKADRDEEAAGESLKLAEAGSGSLSKEAVSNIMRRVKQQVLMWKPQQVIQKTQLRSLEKVAARNSRFAV